MQRFLFFIDNISTWTGKAFAWCIVLITFVTTYDVTVRYLFRAPVDWAFDIEYILYGTLFMMAGAYTLARNGHVRGDVLYMFFKPRLQAGLDLTLYFLFFIPGITALAYAGIDFAQFAWRLKEFSQQSAAHTPLYHFKTVIPIAGALVLLQGLAEIARCIVCLKTGKWPRRAHDVEEVDVEELKKMVKVEEVQAPAAAEGPVTEPEPKVEEKAPQPEEVLGSHGVGGMKIGLTFLVLAVGAIVYLMSTVEHITHAHLGLLMLALIVVAIMLGFPTAFTLMGLGMIFGFFFFYKPDQLWYQNGIFDLMPQRTYGVMTNDVLIAVPLFLFMGYIIERANLIDKLFYSMRLAMKNIPASLAVATIVTCSIFATATGIVGACVTLMGLLALPAMLKAGYDVRLAAGAITAGGTLGILIPPSVLLILYGATAGVSVVKLYAGAFFPGFMLAGLYIVYVIVLAVINPKLAPPLPKEGMDVPFKVIFKMLLTSFFPLAILILAVLGSIVFGIATPAEAAAIGAFGGLALAAAYRQLTWQRIKEAVFLCSRTTAMVCWLFVGSALFSASFALLGGQEVIEKWVLSLGLSPVQFLLLSQAIIFLLGWPLEWTEIIVIFLPIFIPLLDDFGISPLFFGILVAVNLQTAFLSPPVAMSAFYLKGVAPRHVTLQQIFAGMMPYMAIQVFAMFLLYMWPQIAMWLPSVLYK